MQSFAVFVACKLINDILLLANRVSLMTFYDRPMSGYAFLQTVHVASEQCVYANLHGYLFTCVSTHRAWRYQMLPFCRKSSCANGKSRFAVTMKCPMNIIYGASRLAHITFQLPAPDLQ